MAASHAGTKTAVWDFSQALDLVNSLWTPPGTIQDSQSAQSKDVTGNEIDHTAPEVQTLAKKQTDRSPTTESPHRQSAERLQPLGDFKNIFQYLGAAVQSSPTSGDSLLEHFATKLDYASDGATYVGIKKALGMGGPCADGTDIDDSNVATDRSISPPRTALSKKARWRRNQRMKKGPFKDQYQILVSDSEADSIVKRTPARKASIHVLRNDSLPVHGTSHAATLGKTLPAGPSVESHPSQTSTKNSSTKKPLSPILDEEALRTPTHPMVTRSQTRAQQQGSMPRTLSEPGTLPALSDSSLRFTPASVKPSSTKATIFNDPATPSPQPSSLQPMKSTASNDSLIPSKSQSQSIARSKYSIEPKILRSGVDRNWALLLKVIEKFPQDRENLVAPMNMTYHNKHPTGIHVFVDASNIFIGFLDQLKRSRGIPMNYHLPKKFEPSFDAFALLIERRRPVAKRVLVGSNPEVPAFEKARAVGYEVSVLERVLKARELTERQIFFRDRDAGLVDRHAKPPPAGKRLEQQGYVSGPETPTPQYAREAYVEQGVDEILHLKILESVVDCEAPATIVLATGDAAMAEYSEGFMAMVVRALNKGWTVELYSWSQNISSMYKSPRFLKQWGQRFKIVYLDEFAEELLDM